MGGDIGTLDTKDLLESNGGEYVTSQPSGFLQLYRWETGIWTPGIVHCSVPVQKIIFA